MAFYNGLLAGVHLIPSPSRAVSRSQLIPFPFPFERLPRRLQHAVHAEQSRFLTRFMKLDTPPALYDLAQPASVVHNYNTKDATNQNLCRPFSRTNYGLARLSVVASQTWEATPMKIKRLSLNSFKKNINYFY